MKIYRVTCNDYLRYDSINYSIGHFSTHERAEAAKASHIRNAEHDHEPTKYGQRTITIREIEVDKVVDWQG